MGYTFDDRSVQRIAEAVRRSEKRQINAPGGFTSGTPTPVFAKLTYTDEAGLWEWEQSYCQEDGTWAKLDNGLVGTIAESTYAMEANGAEANVGDVVLLRPISIYIPATEQDPATWRPQWTFQISGEAGLMPRVVKIGAAISVSGLIYSSLYWGQAITLPQTYEISDPTQLAQLNNVGMFTAGSLRDCIFVNLTNNQAYTTQTYFAINAADAYAVGSCVTVVHFGDSYADSSKRGLSYPVYAGHIVHIGNRYIG